MKHHSIRKVSWLISCAGNIGNTATITVPVTTENYTINNGNSLIFNLELVEQKPLKPQGEITLQKNEMTYGEPCPYCSLMKQNLWMQIPEKE
ncbi:MAG: hypothetical protein ACLTFZ_03395 [Lachnospiraceae bacterium]